MSDLSPRDQAGVLEVLVASDGWALVVESATERIDSLTRMILAGGLDHDAYVQACAERATALGILASPHQAIQRIHAQEDDE